MSIEVITLIVLVLAIFIGFKLNVNTGLVGIDFIYHQGRLVFNEAEDAVGTRMLYMHTARDIADEYLSLILSRVSM